MKIVNGVLQQARQIASPNFDTRPAGCSLQLLVLHSISLPPGEYGGEGIAQLFTNALDATEHPYYQQIHQLKVSAHLLIRRDGELIQFVNFDHRAWHAGQSSYCGRDNCNDFSIGIELEGTDTDPYEMIQYAQLTAVCRALIEYYPGLSADAITGHEHIAPGRKTDPGPGFDWPRFNGQLVGEI